MTKHAVAVAWFTLCAGCGGSPSGGTTTMDATPGSVNLDGGPMVVRGPDAAVPGVDAVGTTLSPPDAAVFSPEEIAMCEAQLLSDWATTPPSLGLASLAGARSYDQVIQKFMKDLHLPGGSVAVVHGGKLVLAKSYGFRDRDALEPANVDDLFRIASLSKAITSAAVLKLVEEGKLSLDDKPFGLLSDLKPIAGKSVNPKLAGITVRHLLQHTGGWDQYRTFDPMFQSPRVVAALGTAGPASCTDTIRFMLDKPLGFAPGTTTCYANFGYCVLGRVIEKVTGQDYQTATHSLVLDQAGARAMILGHTLASQAAEHEVAYYDSINAPLYPSVFPAVTGKVPGPYGSWALEAMDAHGGWIASAVDLLRVQVALDGRGSGPRVLQPASITAMTANPGVPACAEDGSGGTTPPDVHAWYGFGWEVNDSPNWWHSGYLDGTASFTVHTGDGFGWAALFNSASGAKMFNRLDNDLWKAFEGAGALAGDDLFDQFGAWSEWLAGTDHAVRATTEQKTGHYPSRIEGRLQAGVVQYRAEFAPLHAGWVSQTEGGLDCPNFRARKSDMAGRGFDLVGLQVFKDGTGLRRYQASWLKH